MPVVVDFLLSYVLRVYLLIGLALWRMGCDWHQISSGRMHKLWFEYLKPIIFSFTNASQEER